MNASILTLVHDRAGALSNTLAGIARGSLLPTEVVIVHINEKPYPLSPYPFTIRQVLLDSGSSLNLSEARNLAMAYSANEFNIFLDVDCIPGVQLLARYLAAFGKEDILWSGRVRYLPQNAMSLPAWENKLHALSDPDPVRGKVTHLPYTLFWSLNFACSKAVFDRIGGFDTRYVGYGAEDTDFAFTARDKSVKLGTVGATAFHQYHPSYAPPLNHLERIVENAMLFKRKWHQWPMEGWLEKFKALGYIHWNDAQIHLLRTPTPDELNATLR